MSPIDLGRPNRQAENLHNPNCVRRCLACGSQISQKRYRKCRWKLEEVHVWVLNAVAYLGFHKGDQIFSGH